MRPGVDPRGTRTAGTASTARRSSWQRRQVHNGGRIETRGAVLTHAPAGVRRQERPEGPAMTQWLYSSPPGSVRLAEVDECFFELQGSYGGNNAIHRLDAID